jgi:hypothetical protein
MRGGFASCTKTGRNIAMGRKVGESLARGTSSTKSSSEEVGTCGYILCIILTIILINQIIQAANKYQAQ